MNFKLLVITAICFSSLQLLAKTSAPAYSSVPAVDCVINPSLVVDLSSPIPGVMEDLYVERSQQVSAGQVIAQVEASVDRANVKLARYRAYADSGTGLGTVNVDFDQRRKKRVESLLEEQNVSREIVDQVEREVQLSNWKLQQARELADIRKLELLKAEEQLQQKSIKAPFDGFVLDTFKNRGEYVDDQAILRLAQLDPLVIEAIVPMEYFGVLNLGMHAEIVPDVLLTDTLTAVVTAVDRIGDTASNTFGVKLSMPNPDHRIPAGVKCIVKFLETSSDYITEATDKIDANTANSAQPAKLTDQQDRESVPTSTSADFSPVALSVSHHANAERRPLVDPTATEDAIAMEEIPEVQAALPAALGSDIDISDPQKPSKKVPNHYKVMIEQPASKAATWKLVDRLRAAGVTDFLVSGDAAKDRYVSLGVFKQKANAQNRQQMLEKLGFTAITAELY